MVIRGPLACKCDKDAPKIVRPEMPIKPIDRGMPGVNMILSVVIGKYLYHLPHYRQATKTLKDAGVTIAKQTLWDWTWRSAQMLEPLWELMHQRLIQLEYLAADETTAKMVDREKPGKATITTYIWQYFGFDEGKAPYTVFDFARTRAHSAPKAFLDDFKGTLLTDGYSAYQCLSDEITHAGCMAHARRKFKEAMSGTNPSPVALTVLALISKLYQVEDECREMDADHRRDYRQRHSSSTMLRLRLYMEQAKHHATPKSLIGKAITYGLNQWPCLCHFMLDGNLPIDNNAVEREMKSIATGRKNWMFFGSERGGKVAAIFYSIIASARRHDLDVWQYLGDVLRRLADLKPGELEQLLPDVWKKEQASKLEPADNQPITKAA
jgi:transposase